MRKPPNNFHEIDTLGYERWEGTQVAAYLAIQPEAITAEDYEEALNVLPPCRWADYSGVSAFHVSERITGDVVSWYAKSGDKYAEFYGLSTMDGSSIRARFAEVRS